MQSHQPVLTIAKRYRIINKIGAGGMGIVYRATDRLSGQTVALKRVTASGEELQFATRALVEDSVDIRLALAREFRVLASLRHPNIISVLDYGFDDNRQPYFTMELLENTQTIIDAARGKPMALQFELLLQLLQALAYLHRRGITHRDLKPDNVLVANGQVRVLDFGLALARQAHSEEAGVAGTLAYMAPEMLMGKPVTTASDIYAIGIIAYQLFAGKHPFSLENTTVLLNQIIDTVPDVSTLPVDARVAAMIARMLAKDPDERFASAADVLQDYAAAINRPMDYETVTIRESFLQAADFVGRRAQLEQLSIALGSAKNGAGSVELVAGESGVGKSRLLDELRTLGLVSGMLVLRGQAIAEGGAPYLLWRDPLRRLCLQTELSVEEAGVLKALVPDIGKLLQMDVPDAPELDPQGNRNRLLTTIEEVFRRQTQPVMVVLEDLHWSSESIDVLSRLSKIADELPLLIVASYRNDERPALPGELPSANVLTLERLAKNEIAEFCASILGKGERYEHVIDLLERETEGNAFFIVEVLRALAETAGQLDQIGSMPLPQHVFSGGMKAIIAHHVRRVPNDARPFLELAAVAGRELDFAVLQVAIPDNPIQRYLSDLEQLNMLEVRDNRWRFTHDKLRDGLLDEVTSSQKQALHRQIASAIERLYADDPAQTVILAHHWAQAGDTVKEAIYAARAGEQALLNSVYGSAIEYLERALALIPQSADPAVVANIERQLGESYFGLGRLKDSSTHFAQSLALLGSPYPRSSITVSLGALKNVVRQLWQRLSIDMLRRPLRTRHSPEQLRIIARTCERLGQVYFILNERMPSLFCLLRGMNAAEQAGEIARDEQARFYASMTVGAGYVPLHGIANMYMRRAEEALKTVQDGDSITWVRLAQSTYYAGRANWEPAEVCLRQCLEKAKEIGNIRRWEEAMWGWSINLYYRSKWSEIRPLAEELYSTAVRQDDLQTQAAILQIQALCAARVGDFGQALQLSDRITMLPEQSRRGLADLWQRGTLIQIYLNQGDFQAAQAHVDDVLSTIAKSPPTTFFTVEAYVAVIEFYLTQWEHRADYRPLDRIAAALKHLRKFAHVFDVARPRAALCQGWHEWLSEKREKAAVTFEHAISEAKRLCMPYDEGLAHYHFGRLLSPSNQDGRDHLKQAIEIFERLGAAWDAEQARVALMAPRT